MFTELKTILEDFQKQRNKLCKETEGLLKDNFKKIFEKHSKLEAFSWTQYTPGFNDGEPCEFTISVDFEDSDNLTISENASKKEIESINKTLNEVSDIIYEMEDFLKEVFGNGVMVIVTKENISVEDYDCGY